LTHEPRTIPDSEVRRLSEAAPRRPTATPRTPRRLLVFWFVGGYYHEAIPLCSKAVEVLGRQTGAFTTDVSGDPGVFDRDRLAGYDAVLLNNTVHMDLDESQRQAMLEFLAAGKGLVGIHAATDNFYTWPKGAEMLGGLFAEHPWGAGGTWALKVDDPTHPLTAAFGGCGFWLNDEIYQIAGPYSRAQSRVLLSLDMSQPANHQVKGITRTDNDFPVSWIHQWGGGRVFYCSLGHNDRVYYSPPVLRHYLDGIQYALGDLDADATPSARLAPQPEAALCPPPPGKEEG
jgi:type 1 glutamine amidotransferase